jgi:hypothetical protein
LKPGPKIRDIGDLFWAKVEPTGFCWNWKGAVLGGGYGNWTTARLRGYPQLAHRFAYEYLVGPIPDGMVLDHLCRNRICVNPDHLEPVTQQVNVLRGERSIMHRKRPEWRKDTCKWGHSEWREASGRRRCVPCMRGEKG